MIITIKLEVDKNEPLTSHEAHNIYEFLNQYGTVLKIGKIFEKGGSDDE